MIPFVLRNRAPLGPQAPAGSAALFIADPAYCFTDAGGTTPAGHGSPVYVWKSTDGTKTATQATSAARPTLVLASGKWYCRFDSVDDGMTTNVTLGSGWAIFASGIGRGNGSASLRTLQGPTTTDNWLITLSPRGGLVCHQGGVVVSYDILPFVDTMSSVAMTAPTVGGGNAVGYHNGVDRTSGAVAAVNYNGVVLVGAQSPGYAEAANADIRKMAVYTRQLNASENAQLHTWGMV